MKVCRQYRHGAGSKNWVLPMQFLRIIFIEKLTETVSSLIHA